MAFTSAFVSRTPIGPDRVQVVFSYTNADSSTGGEIDMTAYLSSVEFAIANTETSEAATCVLVQRNTAAAGQVTITTVANETGIILAIGQPARTGA